MPATRDSPVPPPRNMTLAALAKAVADVQDPVQRGRYAHIHTQELVPDPNALNLADPYTRIDEQLWIGSDMSGRRIIATLIPAGQAGPPVSGEPQQYDFGSFEFAPVAFEPPATVAQLGTYFRVDPESAESRLRLIDGIAELYRYHLLNPTQRAAILQLLSTAHMKGEGPMRDPIRGRPGLAFSTASADGRIHERLIFDAKSGDLYSYERIAVPAAGSANDSPQTTDCRIYWDHGRTDQME